LLDGLDWKPYTYRWNDEETDASLVEAKGDRIPIRVPDAILGQRTTEHVFASRTQCNTCHHVANQGPMTFNAANLWGERDEELPEWVITSWDELVDRGVVKSGKAVRPNAKLVNAQDRNESLEARARSYLDINCGACHRRNGGATSSLFLGRSIAEAKMGAINELPAQGDFGITDARILTPGSPEKSILFYRLATAGPGKMPKVIGQEPDIEGAKVVWDWIRSMEETKPRALMTPSEISTTERALLFWNQLAETTPEEACRLASSAIKQNRDPAINGLFNRWIEQDQRRVTVGDQPDFDALLKLPGSAIEGQRWYAHASTSQCRKCHHVHKQDALIGPSLAGISKRRTRRQILEHIAEPSREIADQWKTYNVLTIDGLVIAGLKESEAEESLMLKSSDGRVHRIEKDDIESIRIAEQSLMPSGLISAMTPQEVADMLAYLAALP
ncbi:MAG: sugar dehydrogenase, partial [Planctomycetota bacterium]